MNDADANHARGFPHAGRMLIIDDDDVLLSALPWPIKRRMSTIEIDTADSPEEALAHVYSRDYDVIVSDIRMPRMDGVTLLRKLRAIQPATPVILCTACGAEELQREASAAGAFAFITKPLDPNCLVELLKMAMGEYRRHLQEADVEKRS